MVRAGSQVTVNPTDRLGSLDWMTAVIAANDTADNDLTKPEAWIMCDGVCWLHLAMCSPLCFSTLALASASASML